MTAQNSFGTIPTAVDSLGVHCVATGWTAGFAGTLVLNSILHFMNHGASGPGGFGLAILVGASALLGAGVWEERSLISGNIEAECEKTKGWHSVVPYRAKRVLNDVVKSDVAAGLLTLGFTEAAVVFNNNLFWLGSAAAVLGGAALHFKNRSVLRKSMLPATCP